MCAGGLHRRWRIGHRVDSTCLSSPTARRQLAGGSPRCGSGSNTAQCPGRAAHVSYQCASCLPYMGAWTSDCPLSVPRSSWPPPTSITTLILPSMGLSTTYAAIPAARPHDGTFRAGDNGFQLDRRNPTWTKTISTANARRPDGLVIPTAVSSPPGYVCTAVAGNDVSPPRDRLGSHQVETITSTYRDELATI